MASCSTSQSQLFLLLKANCWLRLEIDTRKPRSEPEGKTASGFSGHEHDARNQAASIRKQKAVMIVDASAWLLECLKTTRNSQSCQGAKTSSAMRGRSLISETLSGSMPKLALNSRRHELPLSLSADHCKYMNTSPCLLSYRVSCRKRIQNT